MPTTALPAPAGKPPIPHEHGAWGMLLIPFATAVGVSGMFDFKALLLLVAILSVHLFRAAFLKKKRNWMIVFLIVSISCAAPLLLAWRLWGLIFFGIGGVLLAFRRTNRSVVGELVAISVLTSTAAAGWYTLAGAWHPTAFLLWLFNALYFFSSVFYVKMRVTVAKQRSASTWKEKWKAGASNVIYHVVLLAALLLGVISQFVPLWLLLAYAPILVRAFGGFVRLTPQINIRRIGWTEVVFSIYFAGALIWMMRAASA